MAVAIGAEANAIARAVRLDAFHQATSMPCEADDLGQHPDDDRDRARAPA
ncbi:MAG: hypothetical protein JO287_03795 [Pseudonocardiales bacterium]|nr:hypothetical protein [Pseudonocardiales bacterium]